MLIACPPVISTERPRLLVISTERTPLPVISTERTPLPVISTEQSERRNLLNNPHPGLAGTHLSLRHRRCDPSFRAQSRNLLKSPSRPCRDSAPASRASHPGACARPPQQISPFLHLAPLESFSFGTLMGLPFFLCLFPALVVVCPSKSVMHPGAENIRQIRFTLLSEAPICREHAGARTKSYASRDKKYEE